MCFYILKCDIYIYIRNVPEDVNAILEWWKALSMSPDFKYCLVL